MNEQEAAGIIRRILVALDASPHSLAALQAAAELADRLGAELLGLYVEDIVLLRLADLPLASVVSPYSAQPRQLNRQQLEQQLRIQARQAQRALANLAGRRRLQWTFRVSQGVVSAELLAAAQESDLIILGKSGWSRRSRLGSTARVIVAQAPRQALILQQGARLALPLGVVYDGSPLAPKALAAAAGLLLSGGVYLTVIILARESDAARRLQAEAAAWLRERGLQAGFRWLLGPPGARLTEIVRGEQCGLLVLPGEIEDLPGEALADLLDTVSCPVLVVR